jgi:amino-acid N-acetyltransferase
MIARARIQDWPAIESLLVASGLPLDGAASAFMSGVIERHGDELIGCAAIELFDGAGILRSVAVRDAHRGQGLGQGLVRAAEDLAREAGVAELLLLTETAESWFTRLGYEVIDGEAVRASCSARS